MISIQRVTKRFDESDAAPPAAGASSGPARRAAVYDVSLDVAEGEILCLLGPSGCGKTTLLRLVAGLERPDSGRILLEGQDLADVPVHRRGFGLMFQDFALFPDKTVAQNVAFGLRMAGWTREAMQRRVAEMLALVGLGGYNERTVFALSGGERQRVALARSLAPSPRLLMLDEPLGSLDRLLREGLLDELRQILKRLSITALYVTHDQQEALAVGDRVALLRAGQLVQMATPKQLYMHPANSFAARFLGFTNLLPAHVDAAAPLLAKTALGPVALATAAPAAEGMLLVRPGALLPAENGRDAGLPVLEGIVTAIAFRGAFARIEVTVPAPGGQMILTFEQPPAMAPAPGPLSFALDPGQCQMIPAA
jgi:ABC-type Fe3+/spermidine/putrescine transport system ATPase subunit